jgi:hypothetical protein
MSESIIAAEMLSDGGRQLHTICDRLARHFLGVFGLRLRGLLPRSVIPGGAFLHFRLWIPFYRRAGFLRDSACLFSKLVKSKLQKSMR